MTKVMLRPLIHNLQMLHMLLNEDLIDSMRNKKMLLITLEQTTLVCFHRPALFAQKVINNCLYISSEGFAVV